jgi:transcriptional regulator with XRE-family HTH domain
MVDDEAVTEAEALEIIGRLIKEGRLAIGLRQLPFAKFAEVDTKTLASMEKGTRVAWETNQRKVEKALGWRQGSIQELLDNVANDVDVPKDSITLESMKEGGAEATWQDLSDEENRVTEQPVTRANQLTDEELLAELSYRFRNYKNRFLSES